MNAELFSLDYLTGFVRQAHALGLSEPEAASLVHQQAVLGILNQEHVKAAMVRTVTKQSAVTGCVPHARYFTPEATALAFDCAVKFSNDPACVQFRKLAGVADPEVSLEQLPLPVKQMHLRLKQASGFAHLPLSRQVFLAGLMTASDSVVESNWSKCAGRVCLKRARPAAFHRNPVV